MQKVIRPLSLRESRFCYCCIGVLLPFNTFEVISGAVNYYNHTVLGQSPRLSAYYDRRNRFMTNLRKRKKYMFHFDDQSPQKYVAECEDRIRDRPHAGTVERASNRDTALGKRERERERVFSFVIRVDPSRAFTLRKSGGKQGKGKQHIRSYRLLPQTWPKSLSLSLSLSRKREIFLSLSERSLSFSLSKREL